VGREVDEDQVRQYRRYAVEWAVDLKVADWDEALQLTTENISRGGVFIRTNSAVPEGTRVNITLQLPDNTSLEVAGTVMHSVSPDQALATNVTAGFGLSFDSEHAIDLELLEATAASQAGGKNTYKLDGQHFVLPALVRSSDGRMAEPTRAYPLKSPPVPVPQVPVKVTYAPEPSPSTEPATSSRVTSPPVTSPPSTGAAKTVVGAPLLAKAAQATAAPPVAPKKNKPKALVGADKAPIFGIDFGTTYSSIALVKEGGIQVLEDTEGNTMIPSVVCYPTRGAPPVVGWAAREMVPTHRSTTFVSFKRLLGRDFNDPRVAAFITASPVQLEAGPEGGVTARVHGEGIAIPQVAADVLRHLMAMGEAATGEPVRRAVFSSPVRFGERERRALEQAAKLAGLEIAAMVDEPAAAAMAYGLGRADGERIAIYDFGGGTFDCAVLQIRNQHFSMLSSGGDAWLGGDDFDLAMANHAADVFWQKNDIELRSRVVEWQRLIMLAERVKRKLSTVNSVDLRARRIVQLADGTVDLQLRFNRRLFAELCLELVERSLAEIGLRLGEAGVRPHELDHLVLTGGVSRIPLVRSKLSEYFQREIEVAVNPEQAMVVGNAIYARFLQITGKAVAF